MPVEDFVEATAPCAFLVWLSCNLIANASLHLHDGRDTNVEHFCGFRRRDFTNAEERHSNLPSVLGLFLRMGKHLFGDSRFSGHLLLVLSCQFRNNTLTNRSYFITILIAHLNKKWI